MLFRSCRVCMNESKGVNEWMDLMGRAVCLQLAYLSRWMDGSIELMRANE